MYFSKLCTWERQREAWESEKAFGEALTYATREIQHTIETETEKFENKEKN